MRGASLLPSGLVRWPAAVVWGVWALMLLGLVALVGRYGANVPGPDEWYAGTLETMVGERPVTAEWLWFPWGEHRLVLTKSMLVALARLGGGDFRAAMFASVLGLAVLSALMILAAKRVRGHTSYCDAIFPLALLNFAHAENLLQGWNIQNVTVTVLGGLVLLLIIGSRPTLTLGGAVMVGLCLLLLPLSGAGGAAFVPCLAAWLVYSAARWWHSARPCPMRGDTPPGAVSAAVAAPTRSPGADRVGRRCLLVTGLASVALLELPLSLIGVSYWGDPPPAPTASGPTLESGPARRPGVLRSVLGGVQCLSLMFGPVRRAWPYSGIAAVGLLLLGAWPLVTAWREQPPERFRAPGLLAFLGGIVALGLGVGWGRAGAGPDACFRMRYYAYAVLALCWVYWVGILSCRTTVGKAGNMILLLVCLFFTYQNTVSGFSWARARRWQFGLLEKDVLAGLPAAAIVDRHAGLMNAGAMIAADPGSREQMVAYLHVLRRAKIGVFKHLSSGPAPR